MADYLIRRSWSWSMLNTMPRLAIVGTTIIASYYTNFPATAADSTGSLYFFTLLNNSRAFR